MDKETKKYFDQQFGQINDKLSEHDEKFIKLDNKIGDNFTKLDTKISDNFTKLDSKIENNFRVLDTKIDDSIESLAQSIQKTIAVPLEKLIGQMSDYPQLRKDVAQLKHIVLKS